MDKPDMYTLAMMQSKVRYGKENVLAEPNFRPVKKAHKRSKLMKKLADSELGSWLANSPVTRLS